MHRNLRIGLTLFGIAFAFAVARAAWPALIIASLAFLALAWKRPAMVERLTTSQKLSRIPAPVRATPMRFAAVLAAVVIPFSGVAASTGSSVSEPESNSRPRATTEASAPRAATPTAIPTPEPTAIPTPERTAIPTPEPTAIPTPEPTAIPTPEPTPPPTPVPTPTPAPVIVPLVPQPTPAPVGNCDPSYPTVCIPPGPPDLNCGDISFGSFTVLPPDPHGLDGNDGDGIGCESN